MEERKYYLGEIGDGGIYKNAEAITEAELIARLDHIIAVHGGAVPIESTWPKVIAILLHGEKEQSPTVMGLYRCNKPEDKGPKQQPMPQDEWESWIDRMPIMMDCYYPGEYIEKMKQWFRAMPRRG